MSTFLYIVSVKKNIFNGTDLPIGFSGKKYVTNFYSHLQKYKTRRDFQPILCYDARCNLMFLFHHPIRALEQ